MDVTDRVARRNRIIEILPASNEISVSHNENLIGEVGEGTIFRSAVPSLLFLHDSAPENFFTELMIDAANEEREFSVRYPYLCRLAATVDLGNHRHLSSLLSTTRHICSEKCRGYFKVVGELEKYAKEHLPNARDKKDLKPLGNRTINDARNPLLVSLELHDALGISVGELLLGVFVSGGDTCKWMLGQQAVTKQVVEKELRQFDVKLFENANTLTLRGVEGQAPDYDRWKDAREKVKDWVSKKIDKHMSGESYNIAPRSDFNYFNLEVGLHPIAKKDLLESSVEWFKQLTLIHFGKKYKDGTALAADHGISEEREIFKNRCRHECFDSSSEDDPKRFTDKGAFHSGLSDCFGDSEQAFLTFLEHRVDHHVIRVRGVPTDTAVSGVTIRLFSPRDICKFCRNTLSMALCDHKGRFWLKERLLDFLKKGERVRLSEPLAVRVFGYSISGINSERR